MRTVPSIQNNCIYTNLVTVGRFINCICLFTYRVLNWERTRCHTGRLLWLGLTSNWSNSTLTVTQDVSNQPWILTPLRLYKRSLKRSKCASNVGNPDIGGNVHFSVRVWHRRRRFWIHTSLRFTHTHSHTRFISLFYTHMYILIKLQSILSIL